MFCSLFQKQLEAEWGNPREFYVLGSVCSARPVVRRIYPGGTRVKSGPVKLYAAAAGKMRDGSDGNGDEQGWKIFLNEMLRTYWQMGREPRHHEWLRFLLQQEIGRSTIYQGGDKLQLGIGKCSFELVELRLFLASHMEISIDSWKF